MFLQSARRPVVATATVASVLAFLLAGCAAQEMSQAEAREQFLELNCPAAAAGAGILRGQIGGDIDGVRQSAELASVEYTELAASLRDTTDWPEQIRFDVQRIADDLDANVVPTMDALALARSLDTIESVSDDGQLVAMGSETDRVLEYLGLDPLVLECN